MLSRRSALAALGTVPLVWGVAACGTTEPTATPSGSTAGSTAGQPNAAGPITVTDGRGKQVTVPSAATKVVALEWSSVENVVALGVQPVGVADVKGFKTWDSSVSFATDPTDVGTRGEPSIEAIASLAPDLIIGDLTSIPDAALAQMEKIAPIALFKGGDGADQLGLVKANLTATASLLGKDAEATKLWADFTGHLTETAGKLKAAGHDKTRFVFLGVFLSGSTFTVRVHTVNSLPGSVGKELGLTNGWTEAGDAEWGLGQTDLEGLTRLSGDTRILLWENSSESSIAELAKNPVWQGLPAVKAGHVHPVGDGVWMYGGPASMTRWADQLAGALSK